MTQAQVEAITGPLTKNENGILMDRQNISYNFWDRSESEPKLTEMTWIAEVESDELVYTTSQDVPAFRGICLGDTIDEVFDQFPCTDRELKRWETQYVYGYEGADNYAVLHLIADSYYTLDFFVQGRWRVSIRFSRVQQRVFQIQIYGETCWQDMNQAAAPRLSAVLLLKLAGQAFRFLPFPQSESQLAFHQQVLQGLPYSPYRSRYAEVSARSCLRRIP